MVEEKSGIGGLLCSIFGLILFFMPYFGLPLSIIGFIQSKKIQTSKANLGKTLGVIGIVINSIMLVIILIVLLVAPEMLGL